MGKASRSSRPSLQQQPNGFGDRHHDHLLSQPPSWGAEWAAEGSAPHGTGFTHGCSGLAEASVEMYKNEATYFVNSCTTCRPFPRPPAACHLHSSARRVSRATGSASATASQLRSGVLAWHHLISTWHSSSWLSLNCGSQRRAVTPLTGV